MKPQARSLLIELGTEELPPKALDELAAAFAAGIVDGLARRGIAADAAQARSWCTPRRLAVHVPAVADMQPTQKTEQLGPYLNIALDANGAPTPALLGFAAKNGLAVEALERSSDAKGERFVARREQPGQAAAALVPEIVGEALKALPIPKPMRWGNHDYSFVRPAHWLVLLHGDSVIEGEVLGLRAGRMSRGHRFHHPQPVHIVDADSWLDALRAARVLADPDERRARVRTEVARVAPAGTTPQLSDALCAEIANLTEWPVAIACAFDREFLAVPPEALVMTMETNQKFVPCHAADGSLSEHFIGVANIESREPAQIRTGYERVIRPRFADAKFFFDEDRKAPLAAGMDALRGVTYQQALGSVWDKSLRVAELARVIANRVGTDAALATRAAALSRCDLLSRMVGEFPELQGVMGRHYAGSSGEHAEVARALDEFYAPRHAGAPIAQGTMTVPLAILLPRGAMPANGWPLWQFFHGSGGASFDVVDDGPSLTADGPPAIGEGPGSVVARRGIAAAASALPLNPERLPGASNYAYLNLGNLAAFPYTFQQGVFEQRLLLDALLALRIPGAVVQACGLPAVEQRFDPGALVAGGHSMGGMYTNMIGAVEPRYGALTPFGAGGFWNMMILDTEIVPGARGLLAGTLGVDPDHLTFAHPALALLGLGWEIAEPGAAMARLARRPLPGLPARHVYQPIGLDDKFFPNPVFDAAALAYGNQQAGEIVWPTTQDALRTDPSGELAGVIAYPVRANRAALTSVVVQYADDGILDAHQIHRQLPAVRYQYGCFLASYLRDGIPTVPAPAADERAACP
ncbi:MAG: glycine--tRNA ligase subunit beta [Deltaproteobacteria bacterium]|nr:glycine--tRNA ligase subunit beta [Deltaproteobacteria bacterium]